MLLCLVVVSVSGLKVYAIEEGLGPLAGDTPALTIIGPAYADDDDETELKTDTVKMKKQRNSGRKYTKSHQTSCCSLFFCTLPA